MNGLCPLVGSCSLVYDRESPPASSLSTQLVLVPGAADMNPGFRLGVGFGQLTGVVVGGVEGFWRYGLLGDSLQQAVRALSLCASPLPGLRTLSLMCRLLL